ncbi:MAG: hypothetical protein WC947_10085, partial [Elusimicrobiota bacterium]
AAVGSTLRRSCVCPTATSPRGLSLLATAMSVFALRGHPECISLLFYAFTLFLKRKTGNRKKKYEGNEK